MPLARALDPVALSQEGAIAASSAVWIIPVEYLRGTVWFLLALPAILSLSYSWRKVAFIVALLFAVPISVNILLPNGMTSGLQIAHFTRYFQRTPSSVFQLFGYSNFEHIYVLEY